MILSFPYYTYKWKGITFEKIQKERGEAVSYLYSLGSVRILFWEFFQFGNFEITINSEINVHLFSIFNHPGYVRLNYTLHTGPTI